MITKVIDSASKEEVAQGVAWQGAAQWGTQALSFGIYTILARLLTTEAYGLVAMAGVYVAFVQVFVSQGFGTAIIQRRELDREHLDSAFWIAMATGSLFCVLSILLAGSIAHFFADQRVSPIIGWLSLLFLFGALSTVPTAILTRELSFRALAFRSLASSTGGGALGLVMAYLGCGVWSLVGQQLLGATLSCACLWYAVPWRPSLRVSKRHLLDLYGFSLNITGNDILWFLAQKSDQSLVGYAFGSAGLGPYSLASRVSTIPHDLIIGPLQSVAFPAFSKLQSEPLKLERAVLKFCEMSSFIALPVVSAAIVLAPELVEFLFGSKWASAAPILQILAAYSTVRVVLGFVNPIMLAKGRSDLSLLMEVVLASLTFVGCLVAIRWSPEVVALSLVATMAIFGVFQIAVVSVTVLKMAPTAVLKPFLFPGSATLLMLVFMEILRGLSHRTFAAVTTICICVTAGAVTYLLLALIVRPDLVEDISDMTRALFRRVASRGTATTFRHQ